MQLIFELAESTAGTNKFLRRRTSKSRGLQSSQGSQAPGSGDLDI